MARSGIVDSIKVDSYENYKTYINAYPSLFKATTTIDASSQPLLATLRAQVWMAFRDLKQLDPATKSEIATTLDLSGKYLDIWNSFSTLIHDNNGFSATQQNTIFNLLTTIPSNILKLGGISQNEFLGNIGANSENFVNKSCVNIFNFAVGTITENSFPDDISPVYIDVFTAALAHEANHIIDSIYIGSDPALKARRDALIAQAGMTDLQYLRSQVGAAYFQANPQEFIASISNEWFTDTGNTLTLALNRFDQGYKEPLNQFLYFTDLYTGGGNKSTYYKIDSTGSIKTGQVPVSRDSSQRIVSLTLKRITYNFVLDRAGNVTSYTKN